MTKEKAGQYAQQNLDQKSQSRHGTISNGESQDVNVMNAGEPSAFNQDDQDQGQLDLLAGSDPRQMVHGPPGAASSSNNGGS